jgi:hydroxymethylpyrimidine pyrophosphatase-like HAD family hydrolase
MKNQINANISISDIDPFKKHFITDDGTIVTNFSGSDLFSIHITASHAEALLDWAQSIYDTFVENGYTENLKTYGMFTSAGNNLVRIAIHIAINDREKIWAINDREKIWTVDDVTDKVIELAKFSPDNIKVGEVTDTAVRESIYEALNNARNSND